MNRGEKEFFSLEKIRQLPFRKKMRIKTTVTFLEKKTGDILK
jgi:hypothetical protein